MGLKIFLVVLFVALIIFMVYSRAGNKKKLIFLGDSITEFGMWPNGYVQLIDAAIKQDATATQYAILGAGKGGNKIYDLYLRLEEDVIAKSPEVVIIMIGINDVWHRTVNGTGTDVKTFELFYKRIIEKLQYANCKIVVCTPTVIGELPNGMNAFDDELNTLCFIIKNLANDYQLTLVDARTAFFDYLQEHNVNQQSSGILTTDGVHLTQEGNALLARVVFTVLKKISY